MPEDLGDKPYEFVEAAVPASGEPGYAVLRAIRATSAEEFVRSLVPSKPMIARIFSEGQLRGADSRVLSRSDVVSADSEVTLALRVTRGVGLTSAEPVSVLYRDPFLLAAEKPAGILVHGDGNESETLTARVQGHLRGQGSDAVPQALHRLDVDTSGIVLFSLAEELQPAFDALVAGDGLHKRYLVVIEGRLPRHGGEWLVVDAPIARDRHDARRMRVGRTGKPSVTRFRELRSGGGQTLVEAELVTGRRHQIRVHLAYVNHPIVGDALYGGARRAGGLLLHAHEVSLAHPVTNEPLVITSRLPRRFGTWSGVGAGDV